MDFFGLWLLKFHLDLPEEVKGRSAAHSPMLTPLKKPFPKLTSQDSGVQTVASVVVLSCVTNRNCFSSRNCGLEKCY